MEKSVGKFFVGRDSQWEEEFWVMTEDGGIAIGRVVKVHGNEVVIGEFVKVHGNQVVIG